MMICWQFLSLRAINLQFLLAELSWKEMKQWSSWMQSRGNCIIRAMAARWSCGPFPMRRTPFSMIDSTCSVNPRDFLLPAKSESIIYTFNSRLSLSANGSEISPKIASSFTLDFINGSADSQQMRLRPAWNIFLVPLLTCMWRNPKLRLILALADSFYSKFRRPHFFSTKRK